jgi:hypothetical protein
MTVDPPADAERTAATATAVAPPGIASGPQSGAAGEAWPPTEPRGVRIERFVSPEMLRPGVGELVRQSGEAQHCGSIVCRFFDYDEAPHNIDPVKISRLFTGEFLAITHDGRQIEAASGYLPLLLDASMKRRIDRGEIAEFAGDVWCEPAQKAPLGYRFTAYDRRSQSERRRERERLRDARRRQTPERREKERRRKKERLRKAAARVPRTPEQRERDRLGKAAARAAWTPARRERERTARLARTKKRPFLAVDGEGAGRDAAGRQPYRLMRSANDAMDFALRSGDGRSLPVRDCLEFLLSLPARPILVGFAIGYDANQIIRGITKAETLKRILEPRQGDHGPLPVYWGDYSISYQQGQYFRVARVDRSGPTPRVLKGSTRTVYDVFGFFQCSFVSAITTWKVGTYEERAIIAANKDHRGEFSEITDAIDEYCRLECRLLAQMMEKLRDACEAADIRPRQWSGSGWVGAFLLGKHAAPKRPLTSREREREAKEGAAHPRKSDCPRRPERDFGFETAASAAFYGGRAEISRMGHLPLVYQDDIHSAYPAAMVSDQMPCPLHAEWEHRPSLKRLPKDGLYVAKITFTHPPGNRWCGLPFRRKGSDTIFFPLVGTGWYWSVEIEAAAKHMAMRVAAVHDVWVAGPRRCNCPPPYGWVREVYGHRQALDTENPGAGIPLKLGLNSLSGKAAQQVGRAPWHDPVTAGLTTAITRARLLEAIATDPEAVVMIATDSIFSTRKLPLDIGLGLGQWDRTEWPDLFIVMPGVYWSPSALDASIRSRGAPRSVIGKAAPRFIEAFDDWLPKMRDPAARGLMLDKREMLPRVTVAMRVFYGCRWALFAKGQPWLTGRWADETQAIGFDWRAKRDAQQIIVDEHGILTFPRAGSPFEESWGYAPADFDRDDDENEDTLRIDENMLLEAMPDRVEWLPHEQ